MIQPQRQSIRLEGHNYSSPGWYYVTICAQNRRCLFGEIQAGEMKLNELGNIVKKEWLKTTKIRKYVNLDEYQIMPNHFHGIVAIKNDVGAYCHTPDGSNNKYESEPQSGLCNKPLHCQSPSMGLGAIIRGFKSACTKQINQLQNISGRSIWQRNYYDHIIRNKTDLGKIRRYIKNNPARWGEDENNPKVRG